jgi:uncharacterized membrane protein
MDRLSKAFIALAAVGIPDAMYHAYGEITAYSAPLSNKCELSSFWGCISVFQSGYTKFPPSDGISMWVYGIIWFPLILALSLWFTRGGAPVNAAVLLPLLTVGNIFTIYLWYLELGVIHAVCPVCVSLYLLNYGMTVLAVVQLLKD